VLFTLAALVAIAPSRDVPAARAATTPATPFVTFLFSRSEISAADGCVRDDRGIATLGGVVAPAMAAAGISGTGSIQTGSTKTSTLFCTHYDETLATSWDRARWLASSYGWTFVSHGATRSTNWASMSSSELWADTCGSARAIDDQALPGGHGLFAYPNDAYDDTVQRDYVSTCFAFGRQYSKVPTTQAYALTPPYYQHTEAVDGGRCNDPALACSSLPTSNRYDLPWSFVSKLQNLEPGDWYTIQAYVLVTGRNPPYATNQTRWDCTSADPRQHWTNDNERYCWNDFRRILQAVPSSGIVTDPLTVAHAFGRPGY
jgi:hypothetical protein